MASIEYLIKMIEIKKAEIAKLEENLKHIKSKNNQWGLNAFYFNNNREILKRTVNKLEKAKTELADYQKTLAIATEKA